MKKVFIVLSLCVAISACGGNSNSGSADSSATASSAPTTVSASKVAIDPAAPAAKLMAAADCYTCHKADVKVIGPAFADIAAKYPSTPANIDTLANKIIKGGKGNWGEVPMTPHPNIALTDAKTIVTYILTLKK